MLRIEEEKTEAARMLRLDGQLVREWVEVLREHAEGAVQLDLAGVSFADAAGVEREDGHERAGRDGPQPCVLQGPRSPRRPAARLFPLPARTDRPLRRLTE